MKRAEWIWLIALACPLLFGIFYSGSHRSPRAPMKSALAQIGSFKTGLEMFKDDNGDFPRNLNAMIIKPTNASTNWHQYFDKIPLDPWGRPYLYVYPGKHNTNSFDLSSAGPDRIPGTADDIVNWPAQQER